MKMKKNGKLSSLKAVMLNLLPSLILVAILGIFTFILTSCSKEDGEQCGDCLSGQTCNSGLSCYEFSDGSQKCAESSGDVCSRF
jgi:hypothetical protein